MHMPDGKINRQIFELEAQSTPFGVVGTAKKIDIDRHHEYLR